MNEQSPRFLLPSKSMFESYACPFDQIELYFLWFNFCLLINAAFLHGKIIFGEFLRSNSWTWWHLLQGLDFIWTFYVTFFFWHGVLFYITFSFSTIWAWDQPQRHWKRQERRPEIVQCLDGGGENSSSLWTDCIVVHKSQDAIVHKS